MKQIRKWKLCILTAALCATFAVPAFAATTKDEYKVASESIRQETKDITAKIRELRNENNAVKEAYTQIRIQYQQTKELPEGVTKEEWEKAKELRRSANEKTRETGKKESTRPKEGEKKNSSVKNAMASNDYDAALTALQTRLEEKKTALAAAERENAVWAEIRELIR